MISYRLFCHLNDRIIISHTLQTLGEQFFRLSHFLFVIHITTFQTNTLKQFLCLIVRTHSLDLNMGNSRFLFEMINQCTAFSVDPYIFEVSLIVEIHD